MTDRRRTRAQSQRPISREEVPHLLKLGRKVRSLRRSVLMTQDQLGRGAKISRQQVARIEAGTRRTRESTLRALAEVLTGSRWFDLGCPEELTAELVRLAGPALAPESAYADKINERRQRRAERWDREERLQALLQEIMAKREQRQRDEQLGRRQDNWNRNYLGGL